MTSQELASLRHESVKGTATENLLDASAAKELAIKHLFEQVSLKRELHVAGCFFAVGLLGYRRSKRQRGQNQIRFSFRLIPPALELSLM
jgi:hypothetical protein